MEHVYPISQITRRRGLRILLAVAELELSDPGLADQYCQERHDTSRLTRCNSFRFTTHPHCLGQPNLPEPCSDPAYSTNTFFPLECRSTSVIGWPVVSSSRNLLRIR